MAHMTKQLLADSLKSLLEKKSIDKITVKEIVQRCDVNRQTFYYNFQDIYDLAEYLFSLEGSRIIGDGLDASNWQEAFYRMMRYLRENKQIIQNVMYYIDRSMAEKNLDRYLYPIAEKLINERMGGRNVDEKDKEFIVHVSIVILVDLLLRWVNSDMDNEYMEDIERMIKLLDGSLEYMIQTFQK